MTDIVPIRRGKTNQVSLLDIQEALDARKQIAEARTSTSTRKSRVEGAKRAFVIDSFTTLMEIQEQAHVLAEAFDASITVESIPLSQVQINKLSEEFLALERLKVQIEAMETRYRSLVFAHLDETGPNIPGRPASQVPGKVEATSSGPHYFFERRGGNRGNPELDVDALRAVLPEHLAAQIFVTIHHPVVEAWDEQVFDEAAFGELVEKGFIDLDVVADHLTPGAWRNPSFYKTLMDGEANA